MLVGLAAVPIFIWVYLLLGRGGFWRLRRANVTSAPQAKRVVAVIPARNEAAVIQRALASLAPQVERIVVVDDGSSDETFELARAAVSNVAVLEGRALPPGWTGKLWALAQGVEHAQTLAPDYLLFTDADIEHGSKSVAELVEIAEARNLDLASYMVKLACVTAAEKALIPAFVFFFLKLYPPAWIASDRFKAAGAAGGCILIRPVALDSIGGLTAIRREVIDDCALARAVKRSGGRIWLGLTDETHSVRTYGGFRDIGHMISRTAFNQLRHSALLLEGTVVALTFTYLLPPVLLLTGKTWPMIFGGIAWVLMSVAYLPTLRFYGRSPLWCLALPLITAFYMGATIYSAIEYWRGRGGEWKGRVQDVRAP
jgi:hopene-associated glycosyltransferase HpnB